MQLAVTLPTVSAGILVDICLGKLLKVISGVSWVQLQGVKI